MNKYIDIRVVSQYEEELHSFCDVLKVIQALGRHGASRDITVSVDGDGSARLAFYNIGEDGGFTEFNSNDIDPDKLEKMNIGE